MFGDMLHRDHERCRHSVGQAAWRLGVTRNEYRELEAGTRWPNFDTYDRICKLFGWPQTFVGQGSNGPRTTA
ncbi:MAG: helix-turn-helix domain-containing protein [Actinomycetota bacterium]|nr:helix-turn-helix domain-containing protein [Actinomycetota bacterium]